MLIKTEYGNTITVLLTWFCVLPFLWEPEASIEALLMLKWAWAQATIITWQKWHSDPRETDTSPFTSLFLRWERGRKTNMDRSFVSMGDATEISHSQEEKKYTDEKGLINIFV